MVGQGLNPRHIGILYCLFGCACMKPYSTEPHRQEICLYIYIYIYITRIYSTYTKYIIPIENIKTNHILIECSLD